MASRKERKEAIMAWGDTVRRAARKGREALANLGQRSRGEPSAPQNNNGSSGRLGLEEALRELQAAVKKGAKETQAFLDKNGAEWIDKALPERGHTPLLAAAAEGDAELWRLLIARGANPSVEDAQGQNALMVAVSSGHSELALLAAEAGCDPAAADISGCTALMHAARAGQGKISEPVARWLIERSDLDAADLFGRTALHCAAEHGGDPRLAGWLAELQDPLAPGPGKRLSGHGAKKVPPKSPAKIAMDGKRWETLDAMLVSDLVSPQKRAIWAGEALSGFLPRARAKMEREAILGALSGSRATAGADGKALTSAGNVAIPNTGEEAENAQADPLATNAAKAPMRL
jgi:hypothetical protein